MNDVRSTSDLDSTSIERVTNLTSRVPANATTDIGKAWKNKSENLSEDELFSLSLFLLEKIKRKSGLKKRHMVLSLLGLLGIYLMLGSQGVLVCNTIGFLYPAWMTTRALARPDLANNIRWLTYWLIFGIYNLLDNWPPQETSYTFYWVVKTLYLVWCMGGNNCTSGAVVMYNYLVKYLVQLEKGFALGTDWKFNRKLNVGTFWSGLLLLAMYLMYGTRSPILCNMICFLYPAKETLGTMAGLNLHDTRKWLTYWFIFSLYNIVDQLPWLEPSITSYWAIKSLFLMWMMCDGAHVIHRYYMIPLCELENIYTEDWMENHPFGGYDLLPFDNEFDSYHSEEQN